MGRTLVIAEAGVNHNGSLDMAKKLALAAKKSGADFIKFQTFKAENLVNRNTEQAEYQKKNTGKTDESQFEMLKRLELSYQNFIELKQYCDLIGIKFLSSPFDIESIKFLSELGMEYMKIPSGEITNLPYLRAVAASKLPIIMSTGMCSMEDIEFALRTLKDNGVETSQITLLHCNTEYPTPFKDVNLNAMKTLEQTFGIPVGYSDHTKGIEVAVAAVALGAKVIEKHFTLDKTLPGPDHIASLEPKELKAMVTSIRNIEEALGEGAKVVTDSEKKNINIARKSIVAAKDIKKGETFTEENLTTKRPGNGISPKLWDTVVGRIAERDYSADELIII